MNRPITVVEERPGLSFAQRWNTYLSLALAVVALALGVTMRDAALNATVTLEDLEAGIRAQVPQGWLLDRSGADYVFRAVDPDALPFKTLLQVSIVPVGPDATPANVLTRSDRPAVCASPAYRRQLRPRPPCAMARPRPPVLRLRTERAQCRARNAADRGRGGGPWSCCAAPRL